MSTNYEELAELAERGELRSKPGTVKRGAAAAAAGRAALMEATGAGTSEEAARLALGRPKVGAERGDSPVVKARVPLVLWKLSRAIWSKTSPREPTNTSTDA